MFSTSLLLLALILTQTEAPPARSEPKASVATESKAAAATKTAKVDSTKPQEEAETPKEANVKARPANVGERGALMKVLQGTWPGMLLDGNRLVISGWMQGSFTASTAAHDNLPMGFNYRANEFLLQKTGCALSAPS
jgi:hypothetical protein